MWACACCSAMRKGSGSRRKSMSPRWTFWPSFTATSKTSPDTSVETRSLFASRYRHRLCQQTGRRSAKMRSTHHHRNRRRPIIRTRRNRRRRPDMHGNCDPALFNHCVHGDYALSPFRCSAVRLLFICSRQSTAPSSSFAGNTCDEHFVQLAADFRDLLQYRCGGRT